jgi:DNA-binding NtrC family response regulator
MVLALFNLSSMEEPAMQRRVLIVDDEKVFLMLVAKAFEDSEVLVDTAETVEDAFDLLKINDYDVVIADIRLTGMLNRGGLEVLKFVKESKVGTKVIIITAYGNPEVRGKAYALGADMYFEKPVSISALEEAVKSLCENG